MLIGHIPAGYLAATPVLDRLGLTPRRRRTLLTVALVASVAPDLDVLAFYATGGQVHHHAFLTHWPLAWLAVTGLGLAVAAESVDRVAGAHHRRGSVPPPLAGQHRGRGALGRAVLGP